MRRGVVVVVAVLALAVSGIAGAFALAGTGSPRPAAAAVASGRRTSTTTAGARAHRVAERPPKKVRPKVPPAAGRVTSPTTTTVPTVIYKAAEAGCPVPPQPPAPPPPPPWHPAVLVPASSLPPVEAPAKWKSDLAPLVGKGMWIWDWPGTDGGDARAIVHQAVQAGLHSIWVRVGDSSDGFYGASALDALVPVAHAAGIKVIAWGFPYLYDPVGDARWTAKVLAWRGPGGQEVDGFSADLEMPTEGVDMTAQRAAVYLETVRRAVGDRLLVATTYPPMDLYWFGAYPYAAMAPYVDAFAPMIYWECSDPGSDAAIDVARLSTLGRPVDPIGQAYSMAAYHGRADAPSGAEITEFMEAGRKAGAVGSSFWVWQGATAQEWAALAAYRWQPS